jgi:DNA polymerase-3 subunit beta
MQAILPRKSIIELSRLLDNTDEEVALVIAPGQAMIDIDTVKLTTKTIDGRFPDYERVIPDNGDKRVIADRETLRRALARTAILSNEKVPRRAAVAGSRRAEAADAQSRTRRSRRRNRSHLRRSSMEIGFNVNYLLDALGVMTAQEVSLELKNAESSGLLHEAGDSSSKYVIMPMRL